MKQSRRTIEIWTDGSYLHDHGRGGYGFVISLNSRTIAHERIYTNYRTTDNNEYELLAAIKGLSFAQSNGYAKELLYVFTDSQMVQRGMSEFLPDWKANNWKDSEGVPIAFKDLWLKLEQLVSEMNVHFSWIRSHTDKDSFNHYIDRAIRTRLIQPTKHRPRPKAKVKHRA